MKKKFRSRIVAALVAVTAITCCFVGSTLAKYTSSSSKTATATVAHWEITNISENGKPNGATALENTFTFATGNKLSPALEANAQSKYVNTLQTNQIQITNKSAVDALITVNQPTRVVTVSEADKANWKSAWGTYETVEAAVFTVSVAVTDADGQTINPETDTTNTYLLGAATTTETGTTTESLYLTITFTWTTQDGEYADAIDTFFGMYATNLTATLNLTATQASQVPAANA